jgi:NADH-quinone oxidoreductase subunit B
MPRPEAIFIAVTHLWTLIDKGMAKAYIQYRENYEFYRRNQEIVLGKLDWPPLYPIHSNVKAIENE